MVPLEDINIVVTTDVHGWLDGHAHPDHAPPLDADFGSLVSFSEHLRAAAAAQGADVFFVDNGDVVDGTGLDAPAIFDVYGDMPLDALNCGNHELYRSERVVDDKGLVDFARGWGGRYLSSNVRLADGTALGSPFVVVRGATYSVLFFGFLYDMRDACDAVEVLDLERTLEEAPWFADALLTEAYDAVVALAHMDLNDALVGKIADAVARHTNKPLQVLAGHSHVRASRQLSPTAAVLEAGHFADTVGVATIRLGGGGGELGEINNASVDAFSHYYVNMNAGALAAFANVTLADFPTPRGVALSRKVDALKRAAGLDAVLGCSPAHYKADAQANDESSLWALYLQDVMPRALGFNASRCFVSSTGSLRYDLFAGPVTADDCHAVEPFEDRLWLQKGPFRGTTILQVLGNLNGRDAEAILRDVVVSMVGDVIKPSVMRPLKAPHLPNYLSTAIDPDAFYDVVVGDFDRPALEAALKRTAGRDGPIATTPLSFDHDRTTQSSDTDAWVRYASTALPNPPCAVEWRPPFHPPLIEDAS